MAIKINNITPEMSVWGMRLMGAKTASNGPEYAYEYEINVGSDGGISLDEPLNLGRYGDKEVCKLIFNISDIQNYNEDGIDNTGEYNVYCVFQHNKIKTTYEVELNGNIGTLVLPEEITNEAGDYEMILVFQEAQAYDEDDTPNVPGIREYFVSDIFKGYVQESAWQYVWNIEELYDFKTGSDFSIYKPPITIKFEEDSINNNPYITTDSNSLGNQGDRYVKQINWGNTDRYGLNKFIVYFFNEEHVKHYAYQIDNMKAVWVPEEVTDLRNDNITNWKMLFTLTNADSTQRLVYNTLEFEITDNWLTVDDLYVDINKNYVLLRDSEDILLLDSEGVILTAPMEE